MRRFILGALLLYAAPLLAQDQGQQSAGIVFYSPGSVGPAGSGLTIGTTTITSGTDKRVPFDDAGTLNEDAGLTYTKGTTTLAATHLLGGTNACAFAADAAAGSVCLVQNGIHSEGATADTKHLYFAFADHPGASTLTWNAGNNVVSMSGADFYVQDYTSIGNLGFQTGSLLGVGTGTAANAAILSASNDAGSNGYVVLEMAGTTYSGTFLGVNRANTAILNAAGLDAGLLIGTGSNAPMYLGAHNAAQMEFGPDDVAPTLSNEVLTTATMTPEIVAEVRGSTSSFTWTNAMVTALGASLTGNIKVATLPAKTKIIDAHIAIVTAGGGTTTLKATLGTVSSTYLDLLGCSTGCNLQATANTLYGDATADRGTNLTGHFTPSYTATTDVYLALTSTGSNLSAVTTSTGRVILDLERLP